MKILFRVDSSELIGSGHVMRCLALADGLKKQGFYITFICRELVGNFIDRINFFGFEVIKLISVEDNNKNTNNEDRYLSFLGVKMALEIQESQEIIKKIKPDWLVVDHYALDEKWENAMIPFSKKIMVIDDIANRKHKCDLLLDQNMQLLPNRYNSLVSKKCKLILGTNYFLLRPEFFEIYQKGERKKNSKLERIFVFFGGGDVGDLIEKTIQGIQKSNYTGVVDVVFGKNSINSDNIKKIFSNNKSILFYDNVENIAVLMNRADLAIGSGGTTGWERCYLSLPSIIITIADNQKPIAQALNKLGAASYLGDSTNISDESVKSTLNEFIANPSILEKLSLNSKKIVDGKGVERVINEMKLFLSLRRAVTDDVKAIFDLRNHPVIRNNSYDTEELIYENHVTWFYQSLKNVNREILMVFDLWDQLVGVIRFDYVSDYAEVSIYIDPTRHGKGYGFITLSRGLEWVSENSQCKRVIARVKSHNVPSKKLFLKAGFVKMQTYYEKIIKPKES